LNEAVDAFEDSEDQERVLIEGMVAGPPALALMVTPNLSSRWRRSA
jgi:hypothetical protein